MAGEVVIALTLPEPPATNRYWRNFRGRMVVSKDARDYKAVVGLTCAINGCDQPLDGTVEVTVHWYRKRRAGDLDGRLKVLLDALQGYAYANDSQIVALHAYRHDDKHNPRVEVSVIPVKESL